MKTYPILFTVAALLAGGVRGGTIQDTTKIINDCVSRCSKFRRTLDKALAQDDVRLGQNRENQLNNEAKSLSKALDGVGDSWNRDHSIQATKAYVVAAMVPANDINRAMTNNASKMGHDAVTQWVAIKVELNKLASTFGLPGIH